ncbi:VOC family protein [Rhodococcus sp. O3]|uniref:VOC family protein n=1 Tax=Rhodococcus sp. O3 TaxID=3404919 RepID=UPI003B6710F2
MSGKVVHFEIPFDDGDRARSFYREAFGWQINEMPELDYTIVVTGPTDETGMSSEPGYIGGGMMQRGEAAAPVITIDVDDIDKALEKIESLGGKTVAPRAPVGTMGFAAYFKDSEGNLMGLWETARKG